jgi:serine O-acetyltransferase
MTLKHLLLADLTRQWRAAGSQDTPSTTPQIFRSLTNHKYLPVVLFRLARSMQGGPLRPIALVLSLLNQVVFGVEIALQSEIGPGLYFPHTGGIVLGAERIGSNATIYHGVTLGAAKLDVAFTSGMRPILGDNVVVAAGAKVLGGVRLGDRAIVGANAVVVNDVFENEIVGGIPAARIGERKTEDSW